VSATPQLAHAALWWTSEWLNSAGYVLPCVQTLLMLPLHVFAVTLQLAHATSWWTSERLLMQKKTFLKPASNGVMVCCKVQLMWDSSRSDSSCHQQEIMCTACGSWIGWIQSHCVVHALHELLPASRNEHSAVTLTLPAAACFVYLHSR
jgi:hypothetical protein